MSRRSFPAQLRIDVIDLFVRTRSCFFSAEFPFCCVSVGCRLFGLCVCVRKRRSITTAPWIKDDQRGPTAGDLQGDEDGKMAAHHQLLLLLFAFCFVSLPIGVNSILCWECNSEYDHRCSDPFQNHTFVLTDCDQRFLFHYPKKNSTVCRKIIQRVKGDYRYIRSCGFFEDQRTDCYRRAGTFDVQIEYCQCAADKCNMAAPFRLPPIPLALIAIFTLVYFGTHF